MSQPRHISILKCLGINVSILALTLITSEAAARLLGFTTVNVDSSLEISPSLTADPRLGWRMKPGVMEYPEGPNGFRYEILNNGTRSLGKAQFVERTDPANLKRFLLMGDSFAMGQWLTTEDTLSAELQRRLPHYEVINGGTFGYGSQQILLRYQELLNQQTSSTNKALYLFPQFHEVRAVAPPSQLWRLALALSSRSTMMPYCTINEQGILEFHPPEILDISLTKGVTYSAMIAAAYDLYFSIQSADRMKQRQKVTEALLKEMVRVSREHKVDFAVLLVGHSPESENYYSNLLTKLNVTVLVSRPSPLVQSSLAADNDHPGPLFQKYWADLITTEFIGKTPPEQPKPDARFARVVESQRL